MSEGDAETFMATAPVYWAVFQDFSSSPTFVRESLRGATPVWLVTLVEAPAICFGGVRPDGSPMCPDKLVGRVDIVVNANTGEVVPTTSDSVAHEAAATR